MLSYTVSNIVRLNGLYDILCGACLLNIIQIPILNRLHADIFHPALETNDFASRLLGYWVITYGTIRLCHDTHSPLVSLSYYLEAICLWNEINYHPQYSRLLFTSILSAYCGYTYTHLQKWETHLAITTTDCAVKGHLLGVFDHGIPQRSP